MGYVVAFSCPQCGGTIDCDETDRLCRCPYCGAGNFLTCRDYFRYVLPVKKDYETLVLVPYLRFRGAVYHCGGSRIEHRIVDTTQLGTPLNILPATLGLRPQAMKMRFADPERPARFLKCFVSVARMLEKTGNQFAPAGGETVYHRAAIGETMSLIYQPLAVLEDRVIDAVTDQPLARVAEGQDFFSPVIDRGLGFQPQFLAALCPGCGADLTGEKDSVVMLCPGCGTAWQAGAGSWAGLDCQVLAEDAQVACYLPFWEMTVRSTGGLSIATYADFLRVSNQPRVIRKEWEQQEMRFWTPAFKITPKIFLRLASQLTIAQPQGPRRPGIPPGNAHPVTLPSDEAIQSLKLVLANAASNKKEIMPRLPEVQFQVAGTRLVYLPFLTQSHEFHQPGLGLQVNRQALAHGRLL